MPPRTVPPGAPGSGPALQSPCPRESELVAKLREDSDRTLGGVDQLFRRDVRSGEEPQEPALHEGVRCQTAVAACGSRLDGLGESASAQLMSAPIPCTTRTLGTRSTRSGSSGGSSATAREIRFSLPERRCARRRGVPRRRAARPLGSSQTRARLVDWAELGPVAIRLLEVVADDLLVLGRAFACRALEPVARSARACSARASFGIES